MSENDNPVEYFDFGFTNSSIYKDWSTDRKGFMPFVGGCGISSPFKTIQEARKVLFNYLKEDLLARIQTHEKAIIRLKNIQNKLGTDEFNLAKFLVEQD